MRTGPVFVKHIWCKMCQSIRFSKHQCFPTLSLGSCSSRCPLSEPGLSLKIGQKVDELFALQKCEQDPFLSSIYRVKCVNRHVFQNINVLQLYPLVLVALGALFPNQVSVSKSDKRLTSYSHYKNANKTGFFY